MNWVSLRLGDVMEVRHGFAFKGEFFADSGEYVLLTPGNCHEGGGIKLRGDKEKYYLGDIPADYILGQGDILVVMTDLVGTAPVLGGAFVVPESDRFLHNQRLGLVQVTDASRIDRRFLYYLLNTHEYRAQIRGSASGATVRHTSPGRIQAAVLRIPLDTGYQRRVADTLSAYDDLIDTNRRRIKLLEDSVRLLFDEWFRRFRFPGHASTAVVDGLPAGWVRNTLGAVVVNQSRRRIPLSSLEREARPGPYPYHGAAGVLDYLDRYIFEGRHLLVGEDGTVQTPAGTPMLQLVEGKFWVSNHAHVLQGGTLSTEFLYCFLAAYPIAGHVTGVAQPKLTQGNMNRIPVVVPPAELRLAFQEIADPIFEQIFVLQAQVEKLRTARDLLLPRLMSGELTV